MGPATIVTILWIAVIVIVWVAVRSRRRLPRLRPGPGASGTIYDWLNEDKRKAIEIIVEQRAEARDPEDKDGNLPDLERPRPR
jgi:hypothetical protein